MAAALVVTACQKNLKDGSDLSMNEPSSPAQVSISLRSNATKANPQATDAENQVNRVDAFVFNHDGTLDGYAKIDSPAHIKDDGENPTSIVVKATTGAGKRFVVIVNAADDDKMDLVDHINDLNNVNREFRLSNNTRNGFQMYGNATQDLKSGANTVTVPINRAVSRIKIDKITRKFAVPSLASQEFKITKIYVSNVVGTVCNVADATDDSNDGKYFQTIKAGASDSWFNQYAYLDGHSPHPGYINITDNVNVKGLTEINIANEKQTIAQNGELTADTPADGFCFYVMPNDVTPYPEVLEEGKTKLDYEQELQGPKYWAGNGKEWKPSLTKLVIETTLRALDSDEPKTYYYAIPIVKRGAYPEGDITDGIGSNETFNFSEIVLTRPGSEDPDTPVSIAEVDFQLQIQDWTVVPMATGDNGKYEI